MFASREDAGRKLGHWLSDRGVQADLVLGLPRGGVLVAAEVAHVLHRPLDVLIVRKIGHPLQREFALGAMAEGGVVVLDEAPLEMNPSVRAELEYVIKEEQENLRKYQARFLRTEAHRIGSRSILLVDDGLATGSTMEAAAKSAARQGAGRVIVSAPVGSTHAVDRLRRFADQVEVMSVDPEFDAVGRYYENFPQTTDEEVLAILNGSLTGWS